MISDFCGKASLLTKDSESCPVIWMPGFGVRPQLKFCSSYRRYYRSATEKVVIEDLHEPRRDPRIHLPSRREYLRYTSAKKQIDKTFSTTLASILVLCRRTGREHR